MPTWSKPFFLKRSGLDVEGNEINYDWKWLFKEDSREVWFELRLVLLGAEWISGKSYVHKWLASHHFLDTGRSLGFSDDQLLKPALKSWQDRRRKAPPGVVIDIPADTRDDYMVSLPGSMSTKEKARRHHAAMLLTLFFEHTLKGDLFSGECSQCEDWPGGDDACSHIHGIRDLFHNRPAAVPPQRHLQWCLIDVRWQLLLAPQR